MKPILELLNDKAEEIQAARVAFRLDPRYATDVALRAQKIIAKRQLRKDRQIEFDS